METPITVGVTGGIGSGKSTVCNVFKILGVPVFEADKVGKELLNRNEKVKSEVTRLYGEGIYNSDGTVNRKKLAGIIFNDEIQLQKVNKIVHPQVKIEFEKWLQNQHSQYVIHEAAILFESGFYKLMDFKILITAPEKQRIEWVMKRDNLNENQIRERMKRQWPEEKKQKLADVVLHNDNRNLLIPLIIKMDKKLKRNGKIW